MVAMSNFALKNSRLLRLFHTGTTPTISARAGAHNQHPLIGTVDNVAL
jgi:hypothetical protein